MFYHAIFKFFYAELNKNKNKNERNFLLKTFKYLNLKMCKNHAQTLKVIVAAICKQQLDFLHTNTACNWRVQIRTVICKGRFPTSRRSKEILLLITCLGSPNESNYLLQVLHFSRKVRGSIYNQIHSVNNRIFSILDFGNLFQCYLSF